MRTSGRPSNNHQVGHLVVHHQVDHQAVVDIMELLHLMEDILKGNLHLVLLVVKLVPVQPVMLVKL